MDKKDWSGELIRSYQHLGFEDAVKKALKFKDLGFYIKLSYSHSEKGAVGWNDKYLLEIYNVMK